MPPLALISSTARSMPFFQLLPTVAPPPDNSAALASLIGAPDCASAAPLQTAASKTPAKILGFICTLPGDLAIFLAAAFFAKPRCHAAQDAAYPFAITSSNAIPISTVDGVSPVNNSNASAAW